jgi:hypothetical protein
MHNRAAQDSPTAMRPPGMLMPTRAPIVRVRARGGTETTLSLDAVATVVPGQLAPFTGRVTDRWVEGGTAWIGFATAIPGARRVMCRTTAERDALADLGRRSHPTGLLCDPFVMHLHGDAVIPEFLYWDRDGRPVLLLVARGTTGAQLPRMVALAERFGVSVEVWDPTAAEEAELTWVMPHRHMPPDFDRAWSSVVAALVDGPRPLGELMWGDAADAGWTNRAGAVRHAVWSGRLELVGAGPITGATGVRIATVDCGA